MKYLIVAFAIAFLGTVALPSAFAQNRTVGAQSILLDDGAGHTFRITAPAGLNGGNSPMSYSFPITPTGAASGFVTAGTLGGQTLFWNSAAGHLDWEPLSVIMNNTNGNGTNVTISAPLIVSNTINSTGGITGASFTGDGSALTNLAGANISAGTITNTQINATAGIVASKLNDGGATAGRVLTAVGGGAPTWQAPMGAPVGYFNAYTTFVPATVPIGGTVPTTTLAANAGFTGDIDGGFTVISTGVYKVDFAVAHNEPGAFALTVNGIVAPYSQFGCATGTTIINGSAILTLATGDVVRLVNSPNSVTAMTLSPVVPNTVVASLIAVRLQ